MSAGSPSTATVTLEDKPYDAWRFTHFTSTELADTGLSGPSVDTDADGLPHLMEYALGGDPNTEDATNHTTLLGLAADHLTLTYTRPATVDDLRYEVEWTTDLQTWSTGSTVIESVSSTANPDGTLTVTSRAVEVLSTTPRQFLRLRITRL
jgi:hypothetical protein